MITDASNNPLGSAGTSGGSGYRFAQAKSAAVTLPMKVDCKTGYKLYCDVTANVTIEGRFTGDVSWTNLESSYLDLSPFNGIRKAIEIRSTTANVGRVTVKAPLRVGKI